MAPVLILSLDTSSPAGSVAILRDGRVIGSIAALGDEPYSSRLFRQIDFLLSELSLNSSQIDLFAVCSGPGSFTGLRVGLTAAKAWAEVCGKPIAAISALEAVAAHAARSASLLVPVLDARRGQLYFGVYRATFDAHASAVDLACDSADCVASPEAFLATLRDVAPGGSVAIVTPVPEVLASMAGEIRDLGIPVEPASAFLAPFVGIRGFARAQRGALTDSLALDANYVRPSDAELPGKGA